MRYEELFNVIHSDTKYKCLVVPLGIYLLDFNHTLSKFTDLSVSTAGRWITRLSSLSRNNNWDDLEFIEVGVEDEKE